MPTDQLPKQATPAEAWGQPTEDDGFLAELPSGNWAKVRRTLDLPVLLKSGQIPNPLSSIIRKMMDTQDAAFPMDQMEGKATEQLLELLDSTAMRSMIEPKLSRPTPQGKDETWEQYTERIEDWTPDPGTLSIFQLDMNDKMYLFAIAQGMAADLGPFREQQATTLVALQASESLGNAAVSAGGDSTGKRAKPAPTKRTGGPAKRQPAKKK